MARRSFDAGRDEPRRRARRGSASAPRVLSDAAAFWLLVLALAGVVALLAAVTVVALHLVA